MDIEHDFQDVRAEMSYSADRFFFKRLLRTNKELLVSEMKKKNGGHGLRFRDKACGKLV